MTKIIAKKQIEFNRIQALVKVSYKKMRKDIQWILKNFENVKKNFADIINGIDIYLERYFGLKRDNQILPAGVEAINSGYVFIPEFGVFELIYFYEPILQRTILTSIKRLKANQKFVNADKEFTDYSSLEGLWASWEKENNNQEFQLIFEKAESNVPFVIEKEPLAGILAIESSKEGNIVISIKSNNDIIFHSESLTNFNLENNLKRLLPNWESNYDALLVSYDEVQKPPSINGFLVNKEFKEAQLEFSWGLDTTIYEVQLNDLPILPNSPTDAQNWLFDLVMIELRNKNGYFTSKFLKNIEKKVLEQTPLRKRFPRLSISDENYLIKMTNTPGFEDTVKEIIVANDLAY